MMSYPTLARISMVMLIVAKDREKNPVYCGSSYSTCTCIRFQSVTNICNILTITLVHTCCILVYSCCCYMYILAWVDRFSILLT